LFDDRIKGILIMVHFILKMFGAIEVDDSVGFPLTNYRE
jgi:hypothetical protein